MKHYASGKDLVGYDSYEEAVAELKHCVKQGVAEDSELAEEFDLIETIIEDLAASNGVDAEVIWEDLESLDDDELYVFATTSTIMETEAWQKANKRDRTDGMSRKAVKAYRREHPGSKLKTAVTTKPSKLKKGSKASKRRKSYCSRSKGQMKMHNISCAKTPDKAICKARRRWNC
jgi:ribosome-binding ATPase YchF (GTP1/OBG family)